VITFEFWDELDIPRN